MSRETDTPKGVRHWLHPITKGSRNEEHRAHLTARHMKDIPIDTSLIKGGAKNYGTHRVRRKGLPSHVPHSWLVPQPSSGSVEQRAVGKQGGEVFLIEAECYSGAAQRSAKPSPSESQSSPAQGSQQYDSTYSYVFPPGGRHRLDLAAEHGSTVKWEKVCPASAGSLHQATISETEGSLSEPSAESSTQLSPRTTAQDNNEAHAQQPSSSGPDSFAFPELPGVVRNFASMPLKPVPQLPAGAGSTPGPLEESLLRHHDQEAGLGQGYSLDSAQQPSPSTQPIGSPSGAQQGLSSSKNGADLPRSPSSTSRDVQSTPSIAEPAGEAKDAHSVYKAASTAKPCGSASAEKLGPNFEKLVASFQERKAQHSPDHSSRTYSNPVYTSGGLSGSLQALKARSAGAANSSGSRRLSEDTMASTAATKHPRSPALPGMPSRPKQNSTGAGRELASRAPAGFTKVTHQAGSVSSAQGSHGAESGKVSRHAASIRIQEHTEHELQWPQLMSASADVQSKQLVGLRGDSFSAPPTRTANDATTVHQRAAELSVRDLPAARSVTPAELCAEVCEQVISRQLWAILGMLCAAAALFLTCIVLLWWRLLVKAGHPSKSWNPQDTQPSQGTDYASLTPAWWPS